MEPGRPGRRTWFAVGVAAVWAAWLVVAAFVLPVYGSAVSSSSATASGVIHGTMAQSTETLVELNGAVAALEMAVPLLATLVVAIALRSGVQGAPLVIAWAATGVLAAFIVLGALSIGIFMLPATAALVVACLLETRAAPAGT